MKSKKTTYILLVSTLFLWGSVIYRIVSYTRNDIPVPNNVARKTSVPHVDTLDFSLKLDYRDPFFDVGKKQVTAKSTKIVFKTAPKPEPQPPVFKYKGMIRNKKSIYAMIELDGLVETISRYKPVQGYKILSINSDSLIVEKYGQKFSIKAN